MQRARNPIEVAVGVPPILLIGSIRPTVVAGVTQGFVQRETLTSADKFDWQQYLTRSYGSLTTFNLLFKEKEDQF